MIGRRGRKVMGTVALAAAVVLTGCGESSATGEESGTRVLQGGRLFDGLGDALVENPGIVIRDGRFAAIGAEEAEAAVQGGAEVIQVEGGEVILPGFFDMHAHYHADLFGNGRVDETRVYPQLFLANGVTSTFPGGEVTPERMAALQERLQSGEQVGARLFRSGPYFGTARRDWNPDITPEQIHAEVDALVAEGVHGFKAKGISPAALQPLIERAHHHGRTVTGHLESGFRNSVNPRDAILMGINRIEHFEGGDGMPADRSAYASLGEMDPDADYFERIVQLYIDRGVFYDATLSAYGYFADREPEVFEYYQPERDLLTPYARELVDERLPRQPNQRFGEIYRTKQGLVKKFYDMGGGHLLTVGTDHPTWGEYFSGFGFHRELHMYVKSGIPPAAALRFGTINGARALGVEEDLGTIEAGKLADFVIIRGDPLQDIRNTRNVRLVGKEGVVHDAPALLATLWGKLGPMGPDELDQW